MEASGNPVSINQLSEMENISPVFLEQIFFKLRKAGIVKSMRGPGGGFNFEKPLDKLTVKEILDAAGEELNITTCDRRIDNCDKIGECLSHQVWLELSQIINDYFARLTLASVMQKYGNIVQDSGNTGTPPG
jgi:Rrf2 family iron-sulfur cluster assembly transcriptional regulator